MYEKITAFADVFKKEDAADLSAQIAAFSDAFVRSGYEVPDAMEAMGDRAWASTEMLKEDAATMTAEEICICFSAFIQQEAFIPGILENLVCQGVIRRFLERLQELDA